MKKNPQEDLLILNQELRGMAEDVPEMPEDFHASWMRAVEDEMKKAPENNTTVKETRKTNWKRWVAVAAAAVVLVTGPLALKLGGNRKKTSHSNSAGSVQSYTEATSGSSASNGFGVNYDSAMYAAEESDAAYYAEEASNSEIATWQMSGEDEPVYDTNRMIIRHIDLSLSTRNFDHYSEYILKKCTGMGGWVENSNISTSKSGSRSMIATLRVPAEKLDAYLLTLEIDDLIVLNRTENATDVSESYHDTETRLATQKALLERLQNMVIETADLSDLLRLEQEIADTQYTIDKLESSLHSTDRKVQYATVQISLSEIIETQKVEVKQLGFFERLGSAFQSGFEGFTDFLEDLVLFIAEALPVLILLAAGITTVILLRKKSKKRKAQTAAEAKETDKTAETAETKENKTAENENK